MINQSNVDRITYRLVDKYGIALTSKFGKDENGIYVNFIPDDIDPAEGFLTQVRVGWRSISVDFIPGTFSALLIKSMGEAESNKRALFRIFAEAALSNGEQLAMRINDIPVNPIDINEWQDNWRKFQLSLRYMPIIFENLSDQEIEQKIFECTSKFFAMIISLLPLDEMDSETETQLDGLPEGGKTRVEVNRYERNRLNRIACVEKNGCVCLVCGFDFAKTYGLIGEGFIHVHHIVPVSQIGSNYIIDPVKDLVPVCPNCHAMLHRKDPPYTVDELKCFINSIRNKG